VDGTNFQDLVKNFGPLDPIRACHYIYGAAVGLQHAHEIGLVHRDIKPGNILLDRAGVVKILDLGLARLLHDVDDVLTKANDANILGTADYLSPEQAEDSHAVDIRTDIYSLGATFYYLLTWNPPFPEGTIMQKLIWHKNREPKGLNEARREFNNRLPQLNQDRQEKNLPPLAPLADLPDDLIAIVQKMMKKNPAERYQVPADVMAALAPWAAAPISPPSDQEMPQLSPAVLSGASRAQVAAAARSLIIPSPQSPNPESGVRITPSPSMENLANSPTLHNTTTPSLPTLSHHSNLVWESLDETPAATGDDTARREGRPEPARPATPRPATPPRRFPLRWVLLIAAGFVLIGGGVLAAILLSGSRPTPPTGPPPVVAKRLIVSKGRAGTENVHASLAAALKAVAAGDTIVIEEPELTESYLRLVSNNNRRDITIESGLPGGRPAVIRFASSVKNSPAIMLEVFNPAGVENLVFRNIEFDGSGVIDIGIKVSGNGTGVLFDNVTVRNVTKAGVQFFNAAGQSGKPLTLERSLVELTASTEQGVQVEAQGGLQSKWIAIRNNRFVGQGKNAGVAIVGPAVDVEVSNNRIYKTQTGITVGPVPENQPVRVQVLQNTISTTEVGVRFVGTGKFESEVKRNYFHQTKEIARADPGPVTGILSAENGYDPQSQPGPSSLITASKLEAPLLPQPESPTAENFLRFTSGPGPMIGATRIGAH
jgi:serine/threonine protein kinase